MTHTTPSKEELRKLCEFIRNDPSDYIQSGLPKHLARVLTERLDHDDILAEIEERNKEGAEVLYDYLGLEGYRFIDMTKGKQGPIKPTITLAWAAFKEGEK